jgi:phospholipase B1
MEGREEVPKSVHDLRPDDFKVVMGLGDSMMAGFGAKLFNMLDTQLINEYRGISFAMGGDPHSITVPSFIKHYRADLVGASRGTHLLELCHGAFCPPDDAAYRPQSDLFNAAQTGAMCSNLGMETKYMLHQVRHHRLVNITTDWKLLTVFIGTNDICQYACRADLKDGDMGTGEAFEAKLLLNLERIRERLPRTLVAIMQLPDASQAHWFASRHRRCLAAFPLLQMECPCAMLEGEDGRWEMRLLTADYNERILRVAETINRAVSVSQPDRALQDFAVTVIPFMRETDVRDDIPQHFMAKLDCFHPSNTAHKSMAMAYWHSLFLPYGERPVKLTEQMQVYCPTEEDRIII